jgi:hypothetical protein
LGGEMEIRDEVESLASGLEIGADCEEKSLPNEMNLMCPFCLEELGELAVAVCCRLSCVGVTG